MGKKIYYIWLEGNNFDISELNIIEEFEDYYKIQESNILMFKKNLDNIDNGLTFKNKIFSLNKNNLYSLVKMYYIKKLDKIQFEIEKQNKNIKKENKINEKYFINITDGTILKKYYRVDFDGKNIEEYKCNCSNKISYSNHFSDLEVFDDNYFNSINLNLDLKYCEKCGNLYVYG